MTFKDRPLPASPVGATLCSGIGAPEVAAPWIDWRLASEIEPFPRAVLRARFGYQVPEDHRQGDPLLWGDMTEVAPDLLRARGIPLPDALVAGTPCQAFSLAGARGGLADARGNLTLHYVRTCHAIQDARLDGRLFTVWENVPGVLSSRDNAFGCLLGGIVGGEPVDLPAGRKSWPVAGLVAGPRGRAAWRVLDAQFFGVAQRRNRVFLVASLGDGPDPAAILFERKGGDGHPAAGRGPAAQVASRDAGGLDRRVVASSGDLSYCLNAGGMGRCDLETETLIVAPAPAVARASDSSPRPDAGGITGRVAHTLTAEGFDASEDGTGRDAVIVAVNGRQDPQDYGRVAGSLDVDGGANVITAPPDGLAVRKLTPAECHVLQGFPLDHCAIPGAVNSRQYRALGNSMAVPVMRWILDRARGIDAPRPVFDFEAARAAAWGS